MFKGKKKSVKGSGAVKNSLGVGTAVSATAKSATMAGGVGVMLGASGVGGASVGIPDTPVEGGVSGGAVQMPTVINQPVFTVKLAGLLMEKGIEVPCMAASFDEAFNWFYTVEHELEELSETFIVWPHMTNLFGRELRDVVAMRLRSIDSEYKFPQEASVDAYKRARVDVLRVLAPRDPLGKYNLMRTER